MKGKSVRREKKKARGKYITLARGDITHPYFSVRTKVSILPQCVKIKRTSQ